MKTFLSTALLVCALSIATVAQGVDLISPAAKKAFEKEDYAPCITELSKLIVRQPKNSAALVARANCYFQASSSNANYEKLLKGFLAKPNFDGIKATAAAVSKVAELRRSAMVDVDKALTLNPDSAVAHNLKGNLLFFSDREQESLASYSRAIELNPNFFDAYMNRARGHIYLKKYDDATADVAKAIELEPKNIAALNARVVIMIKKANGAANPEAFRELQKIIALEPTNESHYRNAGNECLKFQYKYNCGDFFKSYIAAKPESANAYLGFARSQASVEVFYSVDNREQYWQNAADAYLKAIELAPADIAPYVELFDLYLGKLRDGFSAKTIALNAVAKFPKDARAFIMKGRSSADLQAFDIAIADYSQAIALDPAASRAYSNRATAYVALNQTEKAVADLDKAISLDASNGDAYLDRGNYFITQKKYDQAIADFNSAEKANAPCAKTYRGLVYVTIAQETGERRDTGNYIKGQTEFLTDDTQKCYVTHFLHGVSLFNQGFDKSAAEKFGYAMSVYKKYGYDTAEIAAYQAQIAARAQSSSARTNNNTLSNAKESAVEANLVAKRAEIDLIIQNARTKNTNKERLEPARQMLRLQNDLVQYLTDAVNGDALSGAAKARFGRELEKEKQKSAQYAELVKVTAEAARNEQ